MDKPVEESIKALREHLAANDVRWGAGTYQEYERAKRLMGQWFFDRRIKSQEVPSWSRAIQMVAKWIGV